MAILTFDLQLNRLALSLALGVPGLAAVPPAPGPVHALEDEGVVAQDHAGADV